MLLQHTLEYENHSDHEQKTSLYPVAVRRGAVKIRVVSTLPKKTVKTVKHFEHYLDLLLASKSKYKLRRFNIQRTFNIQHSKLQTFNEHSTFNIRSTSLPGLPKKVDTKSTPGEWVPKAPSTSLLLLHVQDIRLKNKRKN